VQRGRKTFELVENLGKAHVYVPKSNLTVGCQLEDSDILNTDDIRDARFFRVTIRYVINQTLRFARFYESLSTRFGNFSANHIIQ
jgi:hypothetical protein